MSVSAKSGQEVPVKRSDGQDKVSNAAINATALEGLMAERIVELILMKKKAAKIVKLIPQIQLQTVLFKYYFLNKTLEQTAAEMDLSYQWVCRLHGMALVEFEKYTPKGYFELENDANKKSVKGKGERKK